MKTLLVVALLALSTASVARADDNRTWTAFDTVAQVAVTGTLVMDWKQTIAIAHDRQESNPYLGTHPARHKVNAYFSTWIVGHALVSYLLPKPYRTIWQGIVIGVEAKQVHDNWQVGYKVKF